MTAVFAMLPATANPAPQHIPAPEQGLAKDSAAATTCSAPITGIAGHGFKFCGEHWQLSKLPVRFRVNQSGTPAAIASNFILAADLAAAAWNTGTPLRSGSNPGNRCNPTTTIVCVQSSGNTGGVSESDLVNTIVWQNLGATAAPGYANITTSGLRIVDVDIVLNGSLQWYWLGMDLATGLALGPIAPLCPSLACPPHYDVQAILTHEFGHAIGLRHVNPGSELVFPDEAGDAADYNLVMYPMYYPNNATQRALGWGDLLGLQVVMSASMSDP